MDKNDLKNFVLIDDDPISNRINFWVIKKKFPNSVVTAFIDPLAGVNYLEEESICANKQLTVLFLDINMPEVTGWDVLSMIAKFDNESQEWLRIFLLSSSVNENDKRRAYNHPLVSAFIEKPLPQNFYSLFSDIF